MEHSLTARPPLASLETVCIVAREGSLSAAAEVSGVTHGAISRRVSAVENWLGVALFERHGRGVRLTPDGQRFVGRVEQAFSIIDGAADQWHARRGAQLVKMSVVPAFAKLWLFERLASLEAGPPALRIQLDIEARNADLVAGEADLAIRYGHGAWPALDAEPFLPETLYPVANPALATRISGADPNRLLTYPLLHDSDMTGWRTWFGALGVTLKPRPQDRRFEDYTLVLAAAEAGLGIALARVPFADEWLKRSGLVRVSDHAVACPLTYYFVTARRERRPEVQVLIDRMRKAAGDSFV
jgi:LysR family glycine cleavage system transcriptional activator